MPIFTEQKNIYMMLCLLEIVTVVGPHEVSLGNINRLISVIMDDNVTVV